MIPSLYVLLFGQQESNEKANYMIQNVSK
jgi:hypothetical protein